MLDTAYQYIALPDLRRCIRRLKIEAPSSAEAIACDVITVNMNKAPSYAAISYTCGPSLLAVSVNIDTFPFIVRENTVYALWQANQYGKYKYFWLDAVCINEVDLVEKGAQVELMADIYSQAAEVVVSSRAHYDNSELVLHTARALDMSSWCTRTGMVGDERRKPKFEWFESNGPHPMAV